MSEVLVSVNGLSKAFGLRIVLRDIHFEIARGSTAVLLGPNGSGKTTLLRMLSGLSKPTTGTISIGGWTLPTEIDAVRAQLGVVSHLPLLYDDLTAHENLLFFARLYRVDHAAERIKTVIERVGLTKRSHELVRTFSRGMQQRLALGRAMLHDPAVLLLDEPYTGLDVAGAAMLDQLIVEWRATGRTVIASLHELARASALGDQIVILSRGKVALDQPTAAIADLPTLFEQVTT